jgi:hypothetical protein
MRRIMHAPRMHETHISPMGWRTSVIELRYAGRTALGCRVTLL